MSDAIRWEEPPIFLPGNSKSPDRHQGFAAALRARPGEWAVFEEDGAVVRATQIRRGLIQAFRPAGAYETTTRHLPEHRKNHARIYVRFVGEAVES